MTNISSSERAGEAGRTDALEKALETAIRVAGEARIEWDTAPNGMRAGKLLIALSDARVKYRADITEIHATLAAAKSRSPQP